MVTFLSFTLASFSDRGPEEAEQSSMLPPELSRPGALSQPGVHPDSGEPQNGHVANQIL